MTDVPGRAKERKEAPGAAEYRRLQAAGFPAQDLNEWRASESQRLTAAGFSPSEVAAYWGDTPNRSGAVDQYVKTTTGRFAGRGEVADDPWEFIQAGFQSTGLGLLLSGKTPDYIAPENASLAEKIWTGVGQLAGDLPVSVAAFIPAAAPGASAGAALGAAGGPAAPVTVPTGAALGALVTGGAAASAAPVALRETMLIAYGADELNTRQEFLERVGQGLINTGKAGVVGAVSTPVGGVVGGRVLAASRSALLGSTADITTQTVGATALAGALEGRMPDKDDFVAGLALGLGTHGATVVAGRVRPTTGGRHAQTNMETIFRQTGIKPDQAADMARRNPVMRQELLAQDVDGEPVIPTFRREAPDEPPPFEPKAAPETMGPQEPQSQGFGVRRGTFQEAKDFLIALEGSAAYAKAKGIAESDVVSPAGAIGKFQIMPSTARQYGFDPDRLYEPAYNERVADAIIKDLHRRYNGDLEAIAVAYNAGPGRANKFILKGPGTRLDTTDGKTYVRGPADRDESWLPMETQKYLANLRRRGGGAEGQVEPPPVKPGFVRMYHGAAPGALGGHTGSLWFSRSPDYAKNFGAGGKEVWYVDVPEGMIYPDGGPDQGFAGLSSLELPPEFAGKRQRWGGGGGGGDGGEIPPFGRRDQLPVPRKPTEVEPFAEAVEGKRADWAAVSPEDRYAAMDDMVGAESDMRIFDYAHPDRVLDQFVSELRPARVIDNDLLKTYDEFSRKKDLLLEDYFRNTYASDDRASLFIMEGAVDGRTNQFMEGTASLRAAARQAVKDGGNIKDWRNFMLAARTVEKDMQGIKTGFDVELAKAILSDRAEVAKYAEASRMFQEVGRRVLAYATAKGRYSEAQVRAMIEKNLAWISMRRVQGDDEAFKPKSTIGKFKVGRGIQRMEGSDKQIVDPIIASIDNWRQVVADADRNEAAGAVVALAEQGKLRELWNVRRVDNVEAVIPPGAIKAAAKEVSHYFGPEQTVEFVSDALMPDLAKRVFERNGNPNQFMYFRDGKLEIWETDSAELARLLRGAESAAETNIILAGAQAVAAMKRAGITSMPDFALKTTLGDQFGAWINDPNHPPPFVTLALGLIPALTKNKAYLDWVAEGGAGAGATAMDRDYLARDIRAVFEQTGAWDKVWNAVTHPLQLPHIIQERLDAAQRIGYREWATRFKGVDSRKASLMGRKAYIDFKEKATLQMVNTWAKTTPFTRPALLGLKNVGEAIAERPLDTALHLGILGVVATGLYILNDADDDTLPEAEKFANMPRWAKDMFLTTPQIAGVRFKLGLRDSGMLVNATVNRFLDYWRNNDRHAFDGFAKDFMKTLIPSLVPAIAQPIAEDVTNYNFFTGRPLIPASLEAASGPMQYTENTTLTARKLAQWLGEGPVNADVSPIVVDNYIRGYLGTGGIAAAKILNQPDPATVRPPELADNPFVAGFVHRNPGMSSQPIQDFYDAYDRVKTARRDVSLAQGRRDPEEFMRARQNLLASVNAAQVADALRGHQALIQQITKDEDMTVDEKRQFIERQYELMIVVAKRGLQIIDARTDQAEALSAPEAPPPEAAAAPVEVTPNAGIVPFS